MRLIGNLPYQTTLARAERAGIELFDLPRRRLPQEGARCGDSRSVRTMLDDLASALRATDAVDAVLAQS